MRVKVKSDPSLVRDTSSKAILNVNNRALEEYRAAREARIREKAEHEKLKQDVDDIKSMLQELLASRTK